jgi:hypothetical protein
VKSAGAPEEVVVTAEASLSGEIGIFTVCEALPPLSSETL